MSSPQIHALDWLSTLQPSTVALRASASVRARASIATPFPLIPSFDEIPVAAGTIVVAGGGTLMDEAKHFRARQRPGMRLVLMPSIWGSGAESSRIVVLNRNGTKEIEMGDEFLPDVVVYWPDLLATVSASRARHACGDTWAHALEAFFSPLASDAVRGELAGLIAGMLQLPLGVDARWFQVSARACELQAAASVGLVHGIAHVLEYPLRDRYPREQWGHARLCSTLLLPVMSLNRAASSKWNELAGQYALDEAAIWNVLEHLFEPDSYDFLFPLLQQNWMKILRDPCTRANGALIRSRHIEEIERLVRA